MCVVKSCALDKYFLDDDHVIATLVRLCICVLLDATIGDSICGSSVMIYYISTRFEEQFEGQFHRNLEGQPPRDRRSLLPEPDEHFANHTHGGRPVP